ncbi:MAG: hypothetical protein R6X17_09600, partial [Candidatus Competibacteraceae bacterium]
MPNIQRLNTTEADFWPRLEILTAWEGVADEAVTATVREILAAFAHLGEDFAHRGGHGFVGDAFPGGQNFQPWPEVGLGGVQALDV